MKFVKSILILCFLLCLFICMALSSTPAIQTSKVISATEVASVKSFIQQLKRQLLSTEQQVKITLKAKDLTILSQFISQTVPRLYAQFNLSADKLYVVFSYELNILPIEQYMNARCLLVQENKQIAVEECQFGAIPLPLSAISFLTTKLVNLYLTPDQVAQYSTLYQKVKLHRSQVVFTTDNLPEFKLQAKNLTRQLFDIKNQLIPSKRVNNERIYFYINAIEEMNINEHSLAPYLIELFKQVGWYVDNENTIAENQAALWALVIVFGNDRFSHYIGLPYHSNQRFHGKNLADRHDLALHFLYSIFLELTGEQHVAKKIGEYKELSDSNKDGSGFSFADLTADYAGVEFAKKLTTDPQISDQILTRFTLMEEHKESFIFPSITGLPEGIGQKRFEQKYGDSTTITYQQLIQKIDLRINQLYIYQ